MKRIGYGIVEPNHLSAQRNGKIYAQLPAASAITLLENGMFAKYDYVNNQVALNGDGEWLLVFNEVKTYEDRETYKDFAMVRGNYIGGEMIPRLFKTDVGDIFTTNCLATAGTKGSETDMGEDFTVGTYVSPNASTGYLEKVSDTAGEFVWKVVKVYTMPDGQAGVKLQRVK